MPKLFPYTTLCLEFSVQVLEDDDDGIDSNDK